MTRRNPITWDEYEHGQRSDSVSSAGGRSAQEEGDSLVGPSRSESRDDLNEGDGLGLRRRRSSITMRLTSLTDVGGVNSIRSFTRSWQRAAGFQEVIPQRPAFVFAPDQAPITTGHEAPLQWGRSDVEAGPVPKQSLLRQHFEASPPMGSGLGRRESSEAAGPSQDQSQEQEQDRPATSGMAAETAVEADFRTREQKALDHDLLRAFEAGSGTTPTSTSIFGIPPHLAVPPLIGSFASYHSYGTMQSDISRPSMAEAGALWRQDREARATDVADGQGAPILVKEVEQDGKLVLTVEGQSTLPQTIFNSTNVLIGIGLLSLPLGIKYAGWLCGLVMLTSCAAVTAYTARLLARCMDLDPSLITFSDLAFISFGRNARISTSLLFTLELLAACVALFVLFADSLVLLFPDFLSLTEWKMLCAVVMIPLNFLPLRLLSFTSVIGILSCLGIVVIVVVDGLWKTAAPGSLVEPAKTYLFPANWLSCPLALGLLMSPWGGHSVFPNIYRDMRHPHKYNRAVSYTFIFTFCLDTITAVAGLLMFGDGVLDEITSNILQTTGYPRALTFLMCALIAIIPLTKLPLNARPIITTVDVLLGIHQHGLADDSALVGWSSTFRGSLKIAVRVVTIFVFLVISILFPAFDSIMAFMGSALCFQICVALPICFYLKLFGHQMQRREKVLQYVLLVVALVSSLVGTVWAFLPKNLIT